MVSNGFQKAIDEVVSSNQLFIESLEHKGVDVLGIIVNRVDHLCLDVLKTTLKQAIHRSDSLVVSPGDRSSIVLTSLASRYSSSYPDISGILITGGIRMPDTIMRLIEGWKGGFCPSSRQERQSIRRCWH